VRAAVNDGEDEVLQVSPAADSFPATDAFTDAFDELGNEEKNPWLDDEMLDTIQLEADDLVDDEPFQTNSWEHDFENDTRRLKTIAFGTKTAKKSSGEFNPYDTGSMRRGWKK
jgi:hypothetical protein